MASLDRSWFASSPDPWGIILYVGTHRGNLDLDAICIPLDTLIFEAESEIEEEDDLFIIGDTAQEAMNAILVLSALGFTRAKILPESTEIPKREREIAGED